MAISVVGIALELLIIWITRVHGANTTGDEPWYLIESQALWHLHPPFLSYVASDFRSLTFSAFPKGTTIHTPHVMEGFNGPRGTVGDFEPGLPLILAPFFNIGGELIARTSLMTIEIAGIIFLHRRVSLLAGLGRRSEVILGVMFAAPALLIATTEIYPDLISGIVLACAVVEVAHVEKHRQITRVSALVIAVSAAFLPWIQIKNLAVGLIVILSLLVIARRVGSSWRPLVLVGAAVAASWLLLFAYNLRYFGHLLGYPEPSPKFNQNAIQLTLGLVFGRDQGLLVQLPTAIVGVAGLWLARRRLPLAVMTSLAVVGVILLLNGTYTSNPYGGYSFDGRFEWSIMPLMVAWAGWAISRWQVANRSLWGPMGLVAGAWLYEATPILIGHHNYYNNLGSWDPVNYSGWWPGLSRILPQFDFPGDPLGSPAFGLPLEICLFLFLVVLALRYAHPDTMKVLPSTVVFATLAGTLAIVSVTVPTELPASALSFSGAMFGSGKGTPAVTLQTIQPGSYLATLTYALTGIGASATFSIWCESVAGSRTATSNAKIQPISHSRSLMIYCMSPGWLIASLKVPSSSGLNVQDLQIWKTAS